MKYLGRPAVWGSILAVFIIAITAFIYFYPEAPQGDVLRQHDMQQGAAIGHEAQLYREATGHDPRWTNSLFSACPHSRSPHPTRPILSSHGSTR